MINVPTGTELARPFLPAKDFDLSKRFYETPGFDKLLDAEVAVFRMGSGSFLLQAHFQKEWAENFMMQLMVDDLNAWWTHIQSLNLPGRFGVAPPKAPRMQRGGCASPMYTIHLACYGTWHNADQVLSKTKPARLTPLNFGVSPQGCTQ